MRNYSNPKLKLLYLKQFFEEETDEDHPATMPQILAYLEAKGIHAERKSIYADLDYLADYGMDVRKDDRGKSYQWLDRTFEQAELKLIMDSVASCKFLSENKSNALIKKLETLCSSHQRRDLHRQIKVSGRVKSMNTSVLYNVDKIHTAIAAGKTIKFKYFHYNVQKEKEFRKGDYEVSPWALVYDNNNYYLIAYTEEGKNRIYRVDRMANVEQGQKDRSGQEFFESFDLAAFTKATFGMFGRTEEKVEMVFHNTMMDAVIDKFGTDIWVTVEDKDHFRITAPIAVSPQFYAWIFGLENYAKIVAPESAVQGMKDMLEKVNQRYEE